MSMNMHVDVVIVSKLCSAIHPRCTSTMSGSSGELKPLCEQEEPWSQPRPWAPWYNGWWSHVYLKSTWAEDSAVPEKKDPAKKDDYDSDPSDVVEVVEDAANNKDHANKEPVNKDHANKEPVNKDHANKDAVKKDRSARSRSPRTT